MKFKPKHERKFWRLAVTSAAPSKEFNDVMAEVVRLFLALQPRISVAAANDSEQVVFSRLPALYRDAKWRSTTPYDEAADRIGVSFDLASGEVARIQLPRDSAKHLAGSLSDYLGSQSVITVDVDDKRYRLLRSCALYQQSAHVEGDGDRAKVSVSDQAKQ